jgi:cardiolipin synthase
MELENIPWFAALALLGDWLIRVGLSIRVIMRRRAVGTSLAWLSIILLVPFVGGFLYLLIGETHLGRTRAERARKFTSRFRTVQTMLPAPPEALLSRIEPSGRALSRLASNLVGLHPAPGNRWELLTSAPDFFARLIGDIDAAQHSVCLEFYIWHNGGLADDVAAAVERAARRGVQCWVQVDALGSAAFVESDNYRRLAEAGARVHAVLPVNLMRLWIRRLDLRNHRKIVVIDERIAYTGSQNLVDPRYFKQDADVGQWVDAMARVEGPVVDAMWITFASDWELDTGEQMPRLRPVTEVTLDAKGAMLQVVPSGPQFEKEVINQILLTAVYSAQRELVITSPYFVPDESLMIALGSAARRGVAVTVLVPAKNDSRLVRLASEAITGDLLLSGVRMFGFNGGLLHTKSITVDGQLALFGSLNLDPRSLWLNFEISVLIYDAEFTGAIRALQEEYLFQSTEIRLEDWQSCSPWRRVLRNAVRLLAPLL